MRIVMVNPGVADAFYCENCIRDHALARALIALGHDVLMVPVYLPLPAETGGEYRSAPIFFGGIGSYLRQKWAGYDRLPAFLRRALDAPALLRAGARLAGLMDPAELGETTLTMLRAEEGRPAAELDRLIDWLARNARPDVVCLSNVLLVGMAARIRERLGCPVISILQDEDSFLDDLPEPYRTRAWALVAERARGLAGAAAVSRFYRDVMTRRLGLGSDAVRVIYPGIPVADAPPHAPPDPPAIVFLSRMCEEKGLDLVADAFVALRKRPGLERLRLRAAGGSTAADSSFLRRVRGSLARAGADGDAEFLGNPERAGRDALLRGSSVLCVPDRRGEAFGLHVLEALACGVPFALPRIGAYPELLEITGGGVLYPPGDDTALAAALEGLLVRRDEAARIGAAGRAAVLRDFTAARAAERLVGLCREVAG